MLASVENLIQSGVASDYTGSRFVGNHMDRLFLDKPAVNNVMEYEGRLNPVLSKHDDPVTRNYDLSNIKRTHPLVIIGGLLREDPSFIPPDQFIEEIHERRSARMTAG
jgi:hypothetical protein